MLKAITHRCPKCGKCKSGYNDEDEKCSKCGADMEHDYTKNNGGRWFHRDGMQTK